jgi:hypothetical protein
MRALALVSSMTFCLRVLMRVCSEEAKSDYVLDGRRIARKQGTTHLVCSGAVWCVDHLYRTTGTAAPCLSIFKPMFFDCVSESLLRDEQVFGMQCGEWLRDQLRAQAH